jgi:hypothetical protein
MLRSRRKATTPAPARRQRVAPRYRALLPLAGTLLVLIGAACGAGAPQTQLLVVDLIGKFRLAESRPAGGAFGLAQHTLGERVRATIEVPVPSRVIWTIPVPRRGKLVLTPALLPSTSPEQVRFRVGVSDHRIYEGLGDTTLSVGDTAIGTPWEIDLSDYAGLKWSIFYQPDWRVWRLVLNTELIEGSSARALWIEPAIYTDVPAARHYFEYRLTQR